MFRFVESQLLDVMHIKPIYLFINIVMGTVTDLLFQPELVLRQKNWPGNLNPEMLKKYPQPTNY